MTNRVRASSGVAQRLLTEAERGHGRGLRGGDDDVNDDDATSSSIVIDVVIPKEFTFQELGKR